MSLDDALNQLGMIGKYQMMIFLLIQVCGFPWGWNGNIVFTGSSIYFILFEFSKFYIISNFKYRLLLVLQKVPIKCTITKTMIYIILIIITNIFN